MLWLLLLYARLWLPGASLQGHEGNGPRGATWLIPPNSSGLRSALRSTLVLPEMVTIRCVNWWSLIIQCFSGQNSIRFKNGII